MSQEIKRVKQDQGVDHKTAFRLASQAWKHHPRSAANRSLGHPKPGSEDTATGDGDGPVSVHLPS